MWNGSILSWSIICCNILQNNRRFIFSFDNIFCQNTIHYCASFLFEEIYLRKKIEMKTASSLRNFKYTREKWQNIQTENLLK